MNTSLDYNIFLIGFMGAGKSTIAKELEKQLHMRYAEMDQLIAEEEGMSIPAIFEKHGEAYFRDLESRMLQDLEKEKGIIVSCGGGIVVREENKGYMKQNGRVVLLTATPETVYERVKDSTERPILNQNMSVDYIAALQEKRWTLYEATADIVVATDGKSPAEIGKEIIEKLAAFSQSL